MNKSTSRILPGLRRSFTAITVHLRSNPGLFPALLVIVFLLSCNPQKKLIKAPIREEGADYLFEKLKSKELNYSGFSARFSAEYTNSGKKTSFNGQVRIQKDSIIWLTFSPVLGIEVFRIMITQDSVMYINRMNNTYFLGDYAYVNKFLNTTIDYDILQSFLTGNDLSFYEKGKFKASLDRGQYKLSTAERSKLKKAVRRGQEPLNVLIQNIWIDPDNFKITKANVKEIRRPATQLEAEYSAFEMIDQQLFPKEMTFDISADNNLHVQVSFTKISLNQPMSFPFRVPKGYRRVE
jgi:hypothetical protein